MKFYIELSAGGLHYEQIGNIWKVWRIAHKYKKTDHIEIRIQLIRNKVIL